MRNALPALALALLLTSCRTTPIATFSNEQNLSAPRMIHAEQTFLIMRKGETRASKMYIARTDETGFWNGKGERIEFVDVAELGRVERGMSPGDAIKTGLLVPLLLPCVVAGGDCFK